MHMLPSSHGTGVFPHDAPKGNHIDYGMITLPNPNDVRPHLLITSLLSIFIRLSLLYYNLEMHWYFMERLPTTLLLMLQILGNDIHSL